MLPKIGMAASAVALAIAGLCLLFAPAEISRALGVAGREVELQLQMLAAAYLGFAMGNWAGKDSAIGGIYQRPLCLANLAHFLIGALCLVPAAAKAPSAVLVSAAAVYAVFAAFFVWLVFSHQPSALSRQ
jgi:hypothetical protein